MTITPIDTHLVRVSSWFRDRYAVRDGHGWHWDHNGKPVNWFIRRRIAAAITASFSLSTPPQGA